MFPLLIKPVGLGAAIGGWGFRTTVASPLGRAGLTQIVNSGADDANISIGNIGFSFPLYDGDYRANIFIGSNSYITFGFGSTAYSGLSRTNPGRGLLIGAGDRSWVSVYAGSESTGTYRVRWEGSSGTSGPASAFWEVTLFRDGTLMLVTGAMLTGGTSSLTKGDNLTYTDYTYSGSSSFVFQPDGAGSYTVRTGSYGE